MTARTWGDGGGDKREHVIVRVSYPQDLIICRCGAFLRNVQDGMTWRNHGGRVLEFRELADVSDDIAAVEDRAMGALLAIAGMGRRCTCATTDVRECPNYLPGDEVRNDQDD